MAAPSLGVQVGSGHWCQSDAFGLDDTPGNKLPPRRADMLQTPEGSDAVRVRGHGSPGGFQTHSPGRFWYQRFPVPSAVSVGPAVSLAVSVTEVRAMSPLPLQANPGAHST